MTAFTAYCLENKSSEKLQLLLRIIRPVGKYYITKRASSVIVEAMECTGGNGYIEDSFFPRLYREAPVNAIWEGSGNVQCLDVLRAISKTPELMEVLYSELDDIQDPNFIKALIDLKDDLPKYLKDEMHARYMTEKIAKLLQVKSIAFFGLDDFVSSYCATRFNVQMNMFGSPMITQPMSIIEKSYAL